MNNKKNDKCFDNILIFSLKIEFKFEVTTFIIIKCKNIYSKQKIHKNT